MPFLIVHALPIRTGHGETGAVVYPCRMLALATCAQQHEQPAPQPVATSPDASENAPATLGSKAKVTNLETGKSAVVTVEDRGGLPQGRVDLTPATAQKMGLSQKQGVAAVVVQPLLRRSPESINPAADKADQRLDDRLSRILMM